MDPVTLIVAALATGVSTGLGDTVSGAIKDAFSTLKTLLLNRLHDRPDGSLVLDRYQEDPETWEAPLKSELERAGIGDDAEVVALAQRLIELVRAEIPSTVGKYSVDASSAQGIQIGDQGTQHNAFTHRPDPP